MIVVLVTSDLMGMSRIEGAARQAGHRIEVFPNADAVADFCAAQVVDLVLVDLTTPGLDVASLVSRLRNLVPSGKPSVIAFGPHVRVELLAEAATAGCDRVLARGALMAQIDAHLANAGASEH